jgi:antitoxin component YwqK of YwqJK toxin-antitoxin module
VNKTKGVLIFATVFLCLNFNGVCQEQIRIGEDTFNVCNYFATDSTFKYYVDTNLVDGLSDGKWCVLYDDTFHVNMFFDIEGGKINGECYSFSPKGDHIVFYNYLDNLRDGFAIRYYYRMDVLEDVYRIRTLSYYNKGKINGIRYVFNNKERIKTASFWYNGQMMSSKKYLISKKAKFVLLFLKYKEIPLNVISEIIL